MTLEEVLHNLPAPKMPPNFARETSEQIALAAKLGAIEVLHPPPDFAARLANKIAIDTTENPIKHLEPVTVPPVFAAHLAARIAQDANPFQVLTPIIAPANFAHRVAKRIAQDAAINAEHNRTPLYFLATLLAGAAFTLGAFTWRDAQAAGVALFEVLRSLPESLLLPVALVATFAVVATLAKQVARFPAAIAAFGIAAAFVVPQLSSWFGNTRVEGSTQISSIVRFAGDITVASEVRGDVIAIGGSVRLEPGARVSGRVLTFLGDVNLPEGSSAQAVSAILGNLSSKSQNQSQKSFSLPGLSAANALKPLQNLIGANTWQWWYLGLLGALSVALLLQPRLRNSLELPFKQDAGRSLGLGLLLVFLTVPLVALGGISVLGTPFALVLGVFTLLTFTSGAAIAIVSSGTSLTRATHLGAILPGLGLFALSMLYPAIAVVFWLLLGAWGAGALLIAIRDGALVRAVAE